MEISSLIMEIMREKNIMRDRKWNFPPWFCIIRDEKCQKQGRKITFWEIFCQRGRKNAKTGKEFGTEGKKNDFLYKMAFLDNYSWLFSLRLFPITLLINFVDVSVFWNFWILEEKVNLKFFLQSSCVNENVGRRHFNPRHIHMYSLYGRRPNLADGVSHRKVSAFEKRHWKAN